MWDVILNALKNVWHWLLGELLGFGTTAIDWLVSLMPTDANGAISSGWSTCASAMSAANYWVPLDFAITLAFAYVTFVFVFLAVKVGLKLIP